MRKFPIDKICTIEKKTIIYYLVDFIIYSLHLVSLHPLSRDGESEFLIFELQVVIDTVQKTVNTG